MGISSVRSPRVTVCRVVFLYVNRMVTRPDFPARS